MERVLRTDWTETEKKKKKEIQLVAWKTVERGLRLQSSKVGRMGKEVI